MTGSVLVGADVNANLQPTEGNIIIGKGAHNEDYLGKHRDVIVIGEGGYSFIGGDKGSWGIPTQDNVFSFGKQLNGTANVLIGAQTYGRTGSTMIGTHDYTGKMGDMEVDATAKPGEKPSKGYGITVYTTTLGANSFTNGMLATNTGSLSIMTSKFNGNRSNVTQNFGATISGSLNSIESITADSSLSGVANAIVGLANRTHNSNGSLIFGAGNEITNSIADVRTAGTGLFSSLSSAKDLADTLRNGIRGGSTGGSTMAFGGGNKADYTLLTSMIGVHNTITGTENNPSALNSINGYNNTITNSSRNMVMGTNNTLEGTKGNIVFGFSDGNNKIVNSNVIAIGNDSNSKVDGGISLGSNSLADRVANVFAYDPVTGKVMTSLEGALDSKNEEIRINTENKIKEIETRNNTLNEKKSGIEAEIKQKNIEISKLNYMDNDWDIKFSALNDEIEAKKEEIKGINTEISTNETEITKNKNVIKGLSSAYLSTESAVSIGNSEKGITRQITGVAGGTQDTDAVNVAQLKALAKRFDDVDGKVKEGLTISNEGIANAIAMANLPQLSNKQFSVTGAYGNYMGSSSVAVGLNGVSDNNRVTYKASGSLSTKGKFGIGVGIGYQFGKDMNTYVESDKVKELEKTISTLVEANNKNTLLINELMKKINELSK